MTTMHMQEPRSLTQSTCTISPNNLQTARQYQESLEIALKDQIKHDKKKIQQKSLKSNKSRIHNTHFIPVKHPKSIK